MSLLNPMDDDQLDAVIQGLERIKALEAEIARLRLTDAEREAVAWAKWFANSQRDSRDNAADYADILSGLLERLGGGQ